jgi:mRNA-degrading endonuclease RelE of RelBE toxin-antitoxin system
VKSIRFEPTVAAEVRATEQRAALRILKALHRYAETGEGHVKPLSGEFEGLLRLRVGNHRVLFDETEDTITVHRVRDRREAYRKT